MAAIEADPTLAEPLVAGPPLPPRRGALRRPPRDGPLGRRRAVATHPGPPPGPRRLRARGRRGRSPSIAAELGWSADELDASVEELPRIACSDEREAADLPETHLETLLGA